MAIRFDDIGNRLKAFRRGSGLSADEIARRIGISRTALYRFEKGEVVKIDTLEKLSELLDVSVPTLLGVGVEYVPAAVAFFLAPVWFYHTVQKVFDEITMARTFRPTFRLIVFLQSQQMVVID